MHHQQNAKQRLALTVLALGLTGPVLAAEQNVVIKADAAARPVLPEKTVQNVVLKSGIAVFTPSPRESATSLNDIATARPMPLPMADMPVAMPLEGETLPYSKETPGFSPGGEGDGQMTPVELPTPDAATIEAFLEEEAVLLSGMGSTISPQEYGTQNIPYTTMRVDLGSDNKVSALYPYRAAGQLTFKDGTGSYVCSASLIKRGIVVTAAHCVAEFGKKRFYTNFQFIPAKYDSLAPYGTWSVEKVFIKNSYYDGTDSCSQKGVVCQNDVAVMRVAAQSGAYPGSRTGWFGYGYNGYGFTSTTPKLILINQLGYPVSHDKGLRMQRTDSQGFQDPNQVNNTVWGSRQTGGSSGGPEVVNLGISPVLSGTAKGSASDANMIIGVTSAGNDSAKRQLASPFTSNNIKSLIDSVCGTTTLHAACQ